MVKQKEEPPQKVTAPGPDGYFLGGGVGIFTDVGGTLPPSIRGFDPVAGNGVLGLDGEAISITSFSAGFTAIMIKKINLGFVLSNVVDSCVLRE